MQIYDSSLSVIFIPSSETDVLTCSQYSQPTFSTTEATYQVVNQCSLTAPTDGWVYIAADASADTDSGYYGAIAGISIDNPSTIDHNIDRYFDVDIHPINGDTYTTVSAAVTLPLGAGTHNFYFLVRRDEGTGTVRLYDPTINVIYIPLESLDLIPSSISGNNVWTTDVAELQVIRQLPFTAAGDGFAFLSANAWVGSQSETCRGHFRTGVDSNNGDSNYYRWLALYPDSGDGTDKALAITALVPVTTGVHTAYLVGQVYDGSCTLRITDSTLTVLVPPGLTYLPLIAY